MLLGDFRNCSDHLRCGHHWILPKIHRSGARVILAAYDTYLEMALARDRVDYPDVMPPALENAPLLNMQFEEGAHLG
jgi:hypothetical protein